MKTSLKTCYHELINQGIRQFRNVGRITFPKAPDFTDERFYLLNDKWFVEFITHPQVNDVLIDAIDYHFWASIMNQNATGNSVILDDACNWCIEIIQEYWEKKDDAVAAFRSFWSLLLQSQENFKASISPSWKAWGGEYAKVYCKRVERKLRLQLQEEFTPKQQTYVKISHKYTNAVKSYYHNGFIYMLGEFKFNDFYIPPILSEKGSGLNQLLYYSLAGEQNGWKYIFDQDNILYVIGVPGSGKSLFLRNMINNYEGMTFHNSQDYLVIYCDMKTFYTNGSINKKSIPDFLQESIINTVGMGKDEITIEFIRYYLQIGRCIVLMDALDEVPKDNRMALHKKVVSFFKTTHPNNKVCITSRARGFLPQEDIKVFYISELTGKDISNYLDKMIALGKFKASDKDNFLSQAQVLIEKHFLTNFLTLSLMVNIYKAERELPENKIELYKKCFEYIAKKREMEKGSRDSYDWETLGFLMKDSTFISLSTLAAPNNIGIMRKNIEDMLMKQYRLKYPDEATTEYAVQQFLDFCSSRTDLFVLADSDDQFKFFHRSFFEYFYSRYITQQGSVEEMYHLMSQFDEDSEVFELVIALVKEENEEKYQELINLVFVRADKEFEGSKSLHPAFQILTLSMPVIEDAYFRNKFVQIVVNNYDWMTSKSAQQINQAALVIALKRCFQTCPESVFLFQQKCKSLYIRYVIGQFEPISIRLKNEVAATKIGSFYQQLTKKTPAYFHSAVPFYVYAYPGAGTLRDKLSCWGASEIQNFLSAMPNSKEKRKLQNAFKYFAQCAMPHRKEVLTTFSEEVSAIEHNIYASNIENKLIKLS